MLGRGPANERGAGFTGSANSDTTFDCGKTLSLSPELRRTRAWEKLRKEASMSKLTRELFTRLFRDSHESLRRYVRRFVGSEETADDIVQDAFLRTYVRAEGIRTPRAFLFSTARNLAFDARRSRRAQRTDSLGDFEGLSVVTAHESPEARALEEERSRLLREAIEQLSPQCRAVFTLRVFHQLSYKEIAQRLGLSPKTVENHIARAVRETHAHLRLRYQMK